MSPGILLRTLEDRPFEPFRLHLSDGSSHDVTHPELLMVGTRTSLLFVATTDNPRSADRAIKIDNLHITKLVPINQIVSERS
jgi:hypothetical protein